MTENTSPQISFDEMAKIPGCAPMMMPMRSREQFAEQYKDVDVKLRGPIPVEHFLEWLQYAKSVTVVSVQIDKSLN